MLTYLAVTDSNAQTPEDIRELVDRCKRLLPQTFQTAEPDIYVSKSKTAFIAIWSIEANQMPRYLHDDKTQLRFLSGYVTDFSPTQSGQLLERTPWNGNVADFASSPGGIYTLLAMGKKTGQTSAVQAKSGINPVYHTQSGSRIAISDRAIVSHVAARNAVDIDVGFVPSLLQSNFLVDGSTPYRGTFRLAPDQTITSRDGGYRLVRRAELPKPEIGPDLDARIDQFVTILRETVRPYGWTDKPVLRISGGKDSRLLAALLWNQNIDCIVENHNPPQSFEGAISDRVAELCDMKPERNYATPGDILGNFHDGCVDRGGMLNSVPLHYPFPVPIKNSGVAMTLGHAHHPRGGFARTMGQPAGGYLGSVKAKFASKLVRQEFRTNEALIDRYLQERSVPHLLHHSYWAYQDIRVPYYLGVHYTEYASYLLTVYPLLDEKTLLFCEALLTAPNGFYDMVSEMLMFGAIAKLNGALVRIPLADDLWRFDVNGPKEPFAEGYAERTSPIEIGEETDDAPFDPFDPRKLDREVFSYLRGSSYYPFIRSVLTDEFTSFIEEGKPAPAGVVPKAARETVYAAFGCAALLDGVYKPFG